MQQDGNTAGRRHQMDTRKSAWDLEAQTSTEHAMDAVDSGYASWFTCPVTEAGQALKARVEAAA